MAKDLQLPVLTPDGLPWNEQPQWRQDFPIDVPEDNFISRRDFTKFMVLISLAFSVGQFWIAMLSGRRRQRVFASMRIAKTSDVPVGSTISFDYPDSKDSSLLIRTGENSFVAYGSKCTHLSCAVLPDPKAGVLRCPCHHGLFDLSTGRPLAGPPRRPLNRVVLEIKNGDVYAVGIEERTV